MYLRLRTDYPKVPRLDSRSRLLVLRLAQVPGCSRLRSSRLVLLFHVLVFCFASGVWYICRLGCFAVLLSSSVQVLHHLALSFGRHVVTGYVGVSRFQSRDGVYLYSRLRTSDFVPVDLEQEHPEKIERGCLTCSPAPFWSLCPGIFRFF